ncbi:MAG: SLC13 family permease [Planctomycetaceae bacterium]|nr:SLC13 family permease [Planctomycetaceae bacterium]
MTTPQILILAILAATAGMFMWGRWRHDMVAVGALLACVAAGLVAPPDAFLGFGHPAVVTVACVLVLSRALQTSGAVDVLARRVLPPKAGVTVSIFALCVLVAVLSAFMNNVGALALLMPVAIQIAGRLEVPPGRVLMPLAFASILGGTTTLIGTPSNLIVSGFRANQSGMGGFSMFDFAGVGLPVTVLGVAFIALVGWRLVPARRTAGTSGFETGAYLTEARVPAGSKAAGMSVDELEVLLGDADAQIVGLVRNEVRMFAPRAGRQVRAGDILVIEAEAGTLAQVLSLLGLQLEEDKRPEPAEPEPKESESETAESETAESKAAESKAAESEDPASGPVSRPDTPGERPAAPPAEVLRTAETEAKAEVEADPDPETKEVAERAEPSDDYVLMEVAILPNSEVAGRSAKDLLLRTRHGINLLAVSRQGQRSLARLRTLAIRVGDVLLLQGPREVLLDFAGEMGCVPLAERELRIPDRRKSLLSVGILLLSVFVAAAGIAPAAVAFAGGVLLSMAIRTVHPRAVYTAVDWPVVVLLGALLPVAEAMQSTGTADLLARFLIDNVAQGGAVLGLAVILVTTMVLTDLMNNAATAAVMAPIAVGTASQLGVNPDTFLMAVVIGASCAFLTPIGHQNNTLILGPGGLRFGDYWRMGTVLQLIIFLVSMVMLTIVWPLGQAQ